MVLLFVSSVTLRSNEFGLTVDFIILGSGPSGLTAAIYAARAGFDTTIFAGPCPGGLLTTTHDIWNYTGFIDERASLLVDRAEKQCRDLGVKIINISAVKLSVDPLAVVDEYGKAHHAKVIIIATGAQPKMLGALGEDKYMNNGISTCATCDGHFFRNKNVAVIGGGNTAIEDAIYLSKLALSVHVIHRRDKLRAEQVLQKQLFSLPNVYYHWNSEVKEFYGSTDRLEGITLTSRDLKLDGAFIAIGHKPNTEWCKDIIDTDNEGYIVNWPATEIPGVFAAGDVADKVYRQAITAAGYGAIASIEACKYVNSLSQTKKCFT